VLVSSISKAAAALTLIALITAVHVPAGSDDEVHRHIPRSCMTCFIGTRELTPLAWIALTMLEPLAGPWQARNLAIAALLGIAQVAVFTLALLGGIAGDCSALCCPHGKLRCCQRRRSGGQISPRKPQACFGWSGRVGLRATRLVVFVVGMAASAFAPLSTLSANARLSCPASFTGQGRNATAADVWPGPLAGSALGQAVIAASGTATGFYWYAASYGCGCACILFVIATQAFLSRERARDASDAAARLRGALRYISHEARSPLGGAILSLTLMDDAIDDGDTAASKALVGDLHVSLEAAKRHLDDLLLFEKVTGSGGDSGGAWGWDGFGRATLLRQTRAFRGACRAEGIGLSITSAGGRVGVEAVLSGWKDEIGHRTAAEVVIGNDDGLLGTAVEDLDADDKTATTAKAVPSMAVSGSASPASAAKSPNGASPAATPAAAAARSVWSVASPLPKAEDEGAVAWEVFTNWQQLDAIVQNAISNSVKHAPGDSRGRIAVALTVAPPALLPGVRPGRLPDAPPAATGPSVNVGKAAGLPRSRAAVSPGGGAAPPPHAARAVLRPGPSAKLSPSPAQSPGAATPSRVTASLITTSTAARAFSATNTSASALSGPGIGMGAEAARMAREAEAGESKAGPAADVTEAGASAAGHHRRAAPDFRGAGGRSEPRVLVVEVLDNGRGIPASMLQPGRLFRPFQQLRMGDSALRMTSSGLGLSIVKSIVVDQMGGEVGLASREGEGTLFFAHIPVWARRCTKMCGPGDATVCLAAASSAAVDISSASHSGTTLGGMGGSFASLGQASRGVAWPEAPGRARVKSGSASSPFAEDTVDMTDRGPARAVVGRRSRDRAVPGSSAAASGRTTKPGVQGAELVISRRTKAQRAARRDARKREREPGTVSPAAAVPAKQVTALPRVFVVDDEKINRTLMARVIRRWGLDVDEMADGADFVAAVQAIADSGGDSPEWPAFVTLDMQMPGVGGCSALEELQSIARRLQSEGRDAAAAGLRAVTVIGVTGNAVQEDRDRMMSLGARRVLTKPVEPSLVASAVREFSPGVDLPARAFKSLRR